jgi:hypothetical protein
LYTINVLKFKEKKRLAKNKTSTAIALFLSLAFAVSLITCLPTVNAQSEQWKESYAVIMAEPNPVGVGQTMLIVLGISEPLPDISYSWVGLTVTVTKPNNTTETLGGTDGFKTDPTGTTFASYIPDQTGTYYFQTNFPGGWLNTTSYHRWYKPSTSQKIAVTVQEDPVAGAQSAPLPTEYWTRPINTENREWSPIAGSWLMAYYDGSSNPFNPYTTAPNSAHIMFTKAVDFGGIVGGNYSETAYYSGESYENKWDPPVIMNGMLYYNKRLGSSSVLGMACVDLSTGQEVWFKSGVTLSFGQLLNYNSPNQHGVIPYLWSASGTTYHMYDAFTGEWILDMSNVPSGTLVFGPSGELLKYRLYSQGGVLKLSLWDSAEVDGLLSLSYGPDSPMWRPPQGATLNATTGIMWTVNATSVAGSPSLAAIVDDVLVATAYSPEQTSRGLYTQEAGWMHYGFSLKPGQEGKLLWAQNRTVAGNATMMITAARGTMAAAGIYTALIKETKQYIGYDVQTGKELWKTDPIDNDWAMYQMGDQPIAYGKFYTATYSGEVHAYDITNGTNVWTYFDGSTGLITPYGHNPFCSGVTGAASVLAVADGKVFGVNNEHSPSMPLYKGYELHAIDAETGKGLWTILGWYQHPVIADGYLVTLNAADNQIYSFGKGPSALTVEAPMSGVTQGSSIVIRGTVLDVSPGSQQVKARFPNGVAAVSDESMSQWMEYVYMQQPRPTNATGVPVMIDVIDANGNYRNIGNVTSDSSGTFSLTWQPDIPGQYTVIATFAGSNSYWPSSAETSFAADSIPETTPAPTPTPAPMSEIYFLPSVAGIIVAIAVVGAVIVLLLRRRP